MGETLGFSEPSLKGRAMRLLAAREHSRAELERKLQAHEAEPGQLAAALDELQAKGFINEARVVQSVVHRRAERLGTQRVRAELNAKGLPPELVAEAVDDLRATEESRAREVWRRKFGQPASDPRERAKQMRFLAARGFSSEAIRRVVQDADEDD
ncbi:MAG: recombination regulator RecX [Hydrogenophaga sp.]|nr:recombination regulator RecX [Hydrogenophaga sp.]